MVMADVKTGSDPAVYGDPNAVVTSPSVPNFNLQDIFKSFGYYPTQEEIDSFKPIFSGKQGKGDFLTAGRSAIGQYVMTKKSEAERQKNDPVAAIQKRMQESVDLMKNQVTGLQGQLHDVLTSAPQLFGNLTPEQITTYLAPLQTAFKQQLDLVQGVAASRGMAASSTENNALADTNRQFQEKVFSTGLDVGMQSQTARAKSIQDQINNLFGLTGTEEQISANAAGQKSSQDLSQSNLINSLPFFLDQADLQRRMITEQLNSSGGTNWGAIGGLAGTGIGAIFGPAGAMIGNQIGSSVGNIASGNTGSGANQGSNALLMASLMRKPSGPPASSPSDWALFQEPNNPV